MVIYLNNQNNRQIIGKLGESIACAYLIKKRYQIVERNFQKKLGEIDIVAKSSEGVLVFCEVKTMIEKRGSTERLVPEDNLTSKKLQKMERIAQIFAAQKAWLVSEERGWRIDLVVVALGEIVGKTYPIKRITHYENL